MTQSKGKNSPVIAPANLLTSSFHSQLRDPHLFIQLNEIAAAAADEIRKPDEGLRVEFPRMRHLRSELAGISAWHHSCCVGR